MTNSKMTRRALFSSMVALLLCFSMLLGTTYAWFTDTVTTGINTIKSGNLDVNLYYWDNSMPTGDRVSLAENPDKPLLANVKGETILWEPGASGFGQFEVVNEGTLALKYELKIAFANASETNEGKTLADVLSIYAISRNGNTGDDSVMEDASLEELRTTYMDSFVPGYDAQELKDFVLKGYLLPGESFRYEIGAFWEPTDNDNDYNVKGGLTMDFGVTLVATQMTYEEDSYDDQYDKDSKYPIIIDEKLEEDRNDAMKVGPEDSYTTDLNGNALNNNVTVNGGELNISNGDINNANNEENSAGLENYNGTATLKGVNITAGSAADYASITRGADATTTYDDVNIVSAGGGIAAAGGAEVTFNSGSVEVNTSSTSGRYLFYAEGEGTVITINGGDFADFTKTSQNQKRAYIYAGEGTTVNVNGGTFGKASTRSGYTAGILGSGTVIITGGTFGFDPTTWVDERYEAVKSGDTWTVQPRKVIKTSDELATAVANGETTLILADGEYDVYGCGGKTLTIIGSENTVIKLYNEDEDGCDYGFDGSTVTFKGVKFDTTANTGNYKGYARMTATFNDCTFFGAYTTYMEQTFNDCTFDFNNGYFWTWGANSVTFDGCTFNGNSKTILAHGWASTVINIKDCTFAATEKGYTGAGDNTAVVEIDPAGSNTYTINFTGENTKTDSYNGWTRVKDGSTGHNITGLN